MAASRSTSFTPFLKRRISPPFAATTTFQESYDLLPGLVRDHNGTMNRCWKRASCHHFFKPPLKPWIFDFSLRLDFT